MKERLKSTKPSTTLIIMRISRIEIIDKLLSGNVDMELMEKLAERRIKIEVNNDGSTPGGRNPSTSGEVGETDSTGDEDTHSL